MKIAGFDVQDGLKRTMGNRELYLQLLRRFRDDQRAIADKIGLAWRQGDLALAERLAHTLKSVAGLVGAREMQAVAELLEGDIGRGAQADVVHAHLQQIAQDMQLLAAALAPVLADLDRAAGVVADPPGGVDRAAAGKLMQRVAAMLVQGEAEAIELFADSAALLQAALGARACGEIEQALQEYDFDSALAVLTTAAGQAGYAIDAAADKSKRG